MATYTPKGLVPITELTNAAATVYTVPGATTAILRTIHVLANSSAKTFTLALDTDAQSKRIFDAYALTANVPAIFNGWWVVATGKTVQAFASANTAVELQISGFEYA